jgi:hypothetical protein
MREVNAAHAKVRAIGERAVATLRPGNCWPNWAAARNAPPTCARPSSPFSTSKTSADEVGKPSMIAFSDRDR